MGVLIKSAAEGDLAQIRDIFEYYVSNTVVSFLVRKPPPGYIAARYRDIMSRHLPYLVAVNDDGKVLGYSYASAFRGYMLGYAQTVEISVFCHPEHQRRGVGSQLLQALIERLRDTTHLAWEVGHESSSSGQAVRKIIAIMSVDPTTPGDGQGLRDWYVNKHGFEEVGRLKGVGSKKGQMYATQ
jgi:L-amino acid N-acyltransferase YncA